MNIIKVENLNKEFLNSKKETIKVVDDISFEIKKGEFVGFLGPNGAGKTTTLKMLSGILSPTSGNINIAGFDPIDRKPGFKKQIAIVMGQKSQLWWDLPARDTFELNKIIYEIDDKKYKKTLDYLVDILDVSKHLDTQVRKMSLGQRMKMELIASFVYNPKIIFLDEPTIGLDINTQRSLRQFLKEYNQKHKATIILTSHYMGDIEELCERVVIINKGKKVYDDLYKNLIKDYADEKNISFTFREKIDVSKFEKYGNIREYNDYSVSIFVKRENVMNILSQVINNFEIIDLSINELEAEDIISEIFKN